MSASDYDLHREIEAPCCGASISLAASSFVHRGYPRRTDRTSLVWAILCDCGGSFRVAIDSPIRRERSIGAWETRRRLAGGPIFFDVRPRERSALANTEGQ